MKRVFDFFVACIVLILAVPVLFVVAAFVYFIIGSPIFFRQTRPGRNGKPFVMIKFRTMTDARDLNGQLLPDVDRLPPFGRWLRATSIDELPGLWNVLVGDISLVGPRPLLTEYLHLYNSDQMRRHEVRPGITGWAQVNGRNAISWDEKFVLDVWYVDNRCFWLDLKILGLTIVRVVKRDGINTADDTPMPVFTGSKVRTPNG